MRLATASVAPNIVLFDKGGNEMKWLVFFDIEKDSVRQKIADFCLDKRLERVQYSVFLGDMNQTLAFDLAAQIRRRMGDHPGQVRFIPICDRDWKKTFRIQIGNYMGVKPSNGK